MDVHICLVKKKKKRALEDAQRAEQGVIELCEVPDTVAVIAALNVPPISHQSPSRSYCLQCNLLFSAYVQSNHPLRA